MKWTPLILLIACASTAPPANEPACQTCHGTEATAAPPMALGGLTDVSYRGVGAHAAHSAGDLSAPVACWECHVVPERIDDEGHIDDPWPAELKWGELSKTDGATITWNEDLSCSGTYCHGATLSGGTLTEPVWTDTDPAITTCGACHGNPPPAPHPPGACGSCHETARNGIDPALHIDGILQVDGGLGCNACHGANGDPAPPPALNGSTDSTDPGVGAHTAHLNASLATSLACSDCHPASSDGSGRHRDGTTDVILQGRAAANGITPSYDPSQQTCTVYCHDPGAGAAIPTPTWTMPGGPCGTCHAMPPPAPHPMRSDCESCHPDAGSGPSIIDPALHIDGTVQRIGAVSCTDCHGANGDPAPPPALNGSTDPSDPGVGAHAAHVSPTNAAPVACEDCHPVPTAVGDPGHQDGTNDVVLAGRAAAGGVTPSYTAAGQTCTSYCHDPGLAGTTPNPTWTGSLAGCDTCHAFPPPSPHPNSTSCSNCHSNAGPANVFTDPSTHIDGTVNF